MVTQQISALFKEFFASEKLAGMLLIIATALTLLIAQTPLIDFHTELFSFKLFGTSFHDWINHGFMTLFFLLIGLELEREVYDGELSSITSASLPVVAAIGGMAVPALLYLSINFHSGTPLGIAIPTATDIAFAVGILSLFGSRVSLALKIFIIAVAVADDLGAIVIIALFYTNEIHTNYLALASLVFALMVVLNRLQVTQLLPYVIGGVLLWYLFHHSGIHATISGVLLAFVIPYSRAEKNCASYKLQHYLHYPIAFLVLPLFAMANTAIVINTDLLSNMTSPLAIGIIFGLVVGKPLGIATFTLIGIKLKLFKMPDGICYGTLLAIGCLCGIGFTMSIFISILGLSSSFEVGIAKLAIVFASVISAVIGMLLLRAFLPKDSQVT